MVAQLHHWDAHEHPHLGDEADRSRGNGVLLWFVTDDFGQPGAAGGGGRGDGARWAALQPERRQHEIWLEGPEGYRVVVAGPRS